MDILVTNNPLAYEHFRDSFQVEYLEAPLLEVLVYVRDHIHKGRTLLTHPLSGSVKPNETPYKSILVSDIKDKTNEQSVRIIEESIIKAKGFAPRQIPERYLQDLQVVDFSLISGALGVER